MSSILMAVDQSLPDQYNNVLREAQLRVQPGVHVEQVVVQSGAPEEAVIQPADDAHADLLVLGPGRETLTISSLVGRVIRHAHCSVLVARPSPEHGPIVCATDFSDPDFPTVRAAHEQARLLGEPVILTHVLPTLTDFAGPDGMGLMMASPSALDEVRTDARRKLSQLAMAHTRGEAEVVLLDGDPYASLKRLCEEKQARLLVVGTHGRTGLGRLLIGSTAERLARHASCSVLIVPLAEPVAVTPAPVLA
jgi:nucleotide-binding universal stress UspA family protein